MRKIIFRKEFDPVSFVPQVRFVVKSADGEILLNTVKQLEYTAAKSKYTKEEQEMIDQAQEMLAAEGFELMTEAEMDYLVDPLGLKKLEALNNDRLSAADLQRLSGFQVEKRVVPYPSTS